MRQSVAAQEGWGRPGCLLLSRDAGRGSAGGHRLAAARGVSRAASWFNLIVGNWMIVQGIELRRTGKTLDSAVSDKQPT